MKKLDGVALGVLFCLGLSAAGPVPAQDTSHLRSESVDVIAHRGASAYAPENTLAAFGLAHEMGADWFELDCTLTNDHEIIVIHDDTVDRTTDGSGRVRNLSLDHLKTLDAGSWKNPKYAGERLPTLGESLHFSKDRIGVYIEIKDSDDDAALRREILTLSEGADTSDPAWRRTMLNKIELSGTRNFSLTRKTIASVRELGLENQVVIQSFSPIVCAVAIAEAPDIRTEFLGEDTREAPDRWKDVVRWVSVLDPDGFNPNKRAMLTRRDNIDDIRNLGKTIGIWTIDGRRDMIQFAQWGANALITNRPDFCLNVLEENGLR